MGPLCMPFTSAKFYPKVMFLKSIGFKVMGKFPSMKTQAQQLELGRGNAWGREWLLLPERS